MKFIPHILLASFALSTSLWSSSLSAAWISGVGEYHFGPETSEVSACKSAEERAKLDALKKFYGETVSFEQNLSCRESKLSDLDSDDCQLNKMIWSQVGGKIKSTNLVKKYISVIAGSKICHVESVSDIIVSKVEPDPNFDINVRVNQGLFRPGERVSIDIEPSAPMYVAVFNWLPYVQDEKQVVRLFPNLKDTNNLLIKRRSIPSEAYSFEVVLPQKIPQNRSFVDEYLLIVATKEPIKWLEQYSLHDLNARLADLPIDRVRYVKRGYQLLLPKQTNH